MRIFCASIATETNTFSPLKTDLSDFLEAFYAPPNQHPPTPTLCSAVFPVCRRRSQSGDFTLVEGTATWAEPGGTLNQKTWEHLRDEILEQVKQAIPVDAIVLGLHGAMVAAQTLDCEGELLSLIRSIVGPDVVIGATLDPHSHLTAQRVEAADILVAFKEFPHTDFVDCAEDCVDLVLRAVRKEITPHMTTADCRMVEIMPTNLEPMRSFVDRLKILEKEERVLSASLIHGFMAADVPELGTKMLVITDQKYEEGKSYAKRLAQEVFSFRGQTRPKLLTADEAVEQASRCERGPVVISDVWDNPGGGVPGDSTVILRSLLKRGVSNAAVGTIWDPMAVKTCFAAGEGASFRLRFGSKTSENAGDPIDANILVQKLQRRTVQAFGDSLVPLGDCAVVLLDGIEIILNTHRAQSFDTSLFTNLDIDPKEKKILVIKSTNHFYASFSKIASRIIYAGVDGLYPHDPRKILYKNLKRKIWPIVEDLTFESE